MTDMDSVKAHTVFHQLDSNESKRQQLFHYCTTFYYLISNDLLKP